MVEAIALYIAANVLVSWALLLVRPYDPTSDAELMEYCTKHLGALGFAIAIIGLLFMYCFLQVPFVIKAFLSGYK